MEDLKGSAGEEVESGIGSRIRTVSGNLRDGRLLNPAAGTRLGNRDVRLREHPVRPDAVVGE